MNDPKTHRVYLVGGSGGVGKTTISAAFALHLAEQGFRTAVLTVDPARRLADALGVNAEGEGAWISLPNQPEKKQTEKKLFVSMLNVDRYFDRIIRRFSLSDTQREKILANPLYKVMVQHLGGSHEYAAMEKLLELAENPEFDKIVIDTPPTQNALELFAAPQRLADFMDNSVFKWFQGGNQVYLKLFRTGARLAMKLLHTIFGKEFIQSLEEFFNDMEGMQSGFRKRHLEILKRLKSSECSFLLVTTATENHFEEAVRFQDALQTQGLKLSKIIVNRFHLAPPESPAELPTGWSTKAKEQFQAFKTYLLTWHEEEAWWLNQVQLHFKKIPVLLVKRTVPPPDSLAELMNIGKIIAPSTART